MFVWIFSYTYVVTPSFVVTFPVYFHLSPTMPGGGNVPFSVPFTSLPSISIYRVTWNSGISTCGGSFGIFVWIFSYTYVVTPSFVVTFPVYFHLSPTTLGGGNVPFSVPFTSLPSMSI